MPNTQDIPIPFVVDIHAFFSHVGLQELVDELPSIANVAGERQEAIDHILAGISKVQNEASDAADFTPSYDRKQYSEVRLPPPQGIIFL